MDDIGTVHCVFDNGRTLGVIPGVDDFHIVSEDSEPTEDEEMNISMWRSSFEKKLDCFLLEKSGRRWFVLIKSFNIFAGIGGFRSELEKAGGFECVGYCEIDRRQGIRTRYQLQEIQAGREYFGRGRKTEYRCWYFRFQGFFRLLFVFKQVWRSVFWRNIG